MSNYREFVEALTADVDLLPPLDLPIADAIGCVVVGDVVATDPVPDFREVTVEGFAVRLADVGGARADAPISLSVVDTVTAGFMADNPLAPQQAIRVSPGAPLPDGADTVAAASLTVDRGDRVQIMGAVPPGHGFRPAGHTFAPGDVIVRAGERLTHPAVAALAMCGHGRVVSHPRPRVVVVTIGSELVAVNDPGAPGLVHDAAGVLLASTARSLGADAYRVGPVPDDERSVRDAVEDQLVRADLLVTVGGIDSPNDILRHNLERAESARFDGPALNPCPVYGAGRIGPDGTPVIALPGDPATALLAFHALVRPVIDAMRGVSPDRDGAVPTTPAMSVEGSASRLVAGVLGRDGGFEALAVAAPTLRDLLRANAMVVTSPGVAEEPLPVLVWPT